MTPAAGAAADAFVKPDALTRDVGGVPVRAVPTGTSAAVCHQRSWSIKGQPAMTRALPSG